MPFGDWMWFRSKPFCVLAVLLALGSVALQSNTVAAQSATTLTRTCLKLYKAWQKQESYGAFAASPTGHCGFGSKYTTPKGARNAALEECRKSRSGPCKIIAEH
jgi:hypothetical protein